MATEKRYDSVNDNEIQVASKMLASKGRPMGSGWGSAELLLPLGPGPSSNLNINFHKLARCY